MKKRIAIAVILLLALTACQTHVIMEQPNDQTNTLNVQGVSEFDAPPDIAKISFSIQTLSPNAQDAATQNRKTANAVAQALANAGVRSDEVETTDYNIQKLQEWDPTGQKMVDKGYQASNTFTVTTHSLDQVGNLLDVGVQAGANNVQSVTFDLSDAKQKEVKSEALRQSAANAREKADALAEGTGVRIVGVKTIQENNFVVMPYARYDVMASKAEAAPMAPTPISPGGVKVNAQVSVTYEVAE